MHVAKYERAAAGHLLRHYNRSARNNGNKEIDRARSALNYNLCPREQGEFAYYKERLSQVKCQNRKDVKTLCDWVITLPERNFTEQGERVFFETAYKEFARRYGEKNVVSAWVHKDEEGRPHLHFCFIPVVIDRKKGMEKVSAKEALNRAELSRIHPDMEKVMESRFKREVGILNGATAGGNQTIEELKAREMKRQTASLEAVKRGMVAEIAEAIRKCPGILPAITEAVRAVMGEKSLDKGREQREREHSR